MFATCAAKSAYAERGKLVWNAIPILFNVINNLSNVQIEGKQHRQDNTTPKQTKK